jgi:hypothetical protein
VATNRWSNAGLGRSCCLVDLPALAAVSGSMLRRSMIYGYDYVGPDFSDACLRRMDGEQVPWESELHLAAM